jgi:putative transposase
MKPDTTQARQKYSTDLTNAQWALISPLIPPPQSGGRKRTVDTREIVNAIFYLLKSGCTWRLLPNDFPNWKTVYYYFCAWKKDGTWKKIHDELRDKVRIKAGKKKQPTAGVIDSQSVKTTEKGGFVGMTLVKR